MIMSYLNICLPPLVLSSFDVREWGYKIIIAHIVMYREIMKPKDKILT